MTSIRTLAHLGALCCLLASSAMTAEDPTVVHQDYFPLLKNRDGVAVLAAAPAFVGYAQFPTSQSLIVENQKDLGKGKFSSPERLLLEQFNALKAQDKVGILSVYQPGEAQKGAEKQFFGSLESVAAFRKDASFEIHAKLLIGDYVCLYFDNISADKKHRPWFEYAVHIKDRWYLTNGIKNLHFISLIMSLQSQYGGEKAIIDPKGKEFGLTFDGAYRPMAIITDLPHVEKSVLPLKLDVSLTAYDAPIDISTITDEVGDAKLKYIRDIYLAYKNYKGNNPPEFTKTWFVLNEWDWKAKDEVYDPFGWLNMDKQDKRTFKAFAVIQHEHGAIYYLGEKPKDAAPFFVHEADGALHAAKGLVGPQAQFGPVNTLLRYDETILSCVRSIVAEKFTGDRAK